MEYIDLYDRHMIPLGNVKERGAAVAEGEFILAVGIWVINSEHKILLTRRHLNKRHASNLWENTGGYAAAGETGRSAILRELAEETGIRAEEKELLHLGRVVIPPFIGENFILLKDVPLGQIILQPNETIDARWVTYQEFCRMEKDGTLAPSVTEHLAPLRSRFEEMLGV